MHYTYTLLVFGNYQKTFPTPVLDLLELLFDEGFEEFQSYCTELGSPIPSYASFGSTVVPYDQDEIDYDSNLFMADESIKFNDDQGKQEIVTYLGPKEHAKVTKHCIKDSKDEGFFVDGVMLSSLEEPKYPVFMLPWNNMHLSFPISHKNS